MGATFRPTLFNGGRGRDTVTYGAALESVVGKINGQIYENNTVTGLDTLTGIETLIGSSQGDELSGDGGRNTLKGGRGGDLIHGRGTGTASSAVAVSTSSLATRGSTRCSRSIAPATP